MSKQPVYAGFEIHAVDFLCDMRVSAMTPREVGRLMDRLFKAAERGDEATLREWHFIGRLLRPKHPRGSITPSVRRRILARDKHRCRQCRSAERLEIDHVVPVVFGGGADESNLQVLCRPCNAAKGPHSYARQRTSA